MDYNRVGALIEDLRSQGFQIWHTRGKVFAWPLSKLRPEDADTLASQADEVIAWIKAHPPLYSNPDGLVCPRRMDEGGFLGRMGRKPWDHEVTIVLPHLETVELLETSVWCWRQQTVSPYLLVIDTGTGPESLGEVEGLRNVDLEVHFIRGHGFYHTSSVVASACDLGGALCQTPYILFTHVDVFPKRVTLLEELIGMLTDRVPIAAYQARPRVFTTDWQDCPSHILTFCDARVYRRHRLGWNLLKATEKLGTWGTWHMGWPDTETSFGHALREEKIPWFRLGEEFSQAYWQDDRIVHLSAFASVKRYAPRRLEWRYPGVKEWLEATRALGYAAPVPEVTPTSVCPPAN